VNYVSGAAPVLDLIDESGAKETLAIDGWKTENLIESLTQFLR
jgi:hypothetical protein